MIARIRIEAPAKVNLRLMVLAREESGFHGLETLFCALELSDVLVLERGDVEGIALRVEGDVATGPPDENLVVRAARRFYNEIGEGPALGIVLEKRIPAAAGLGGGSSDAAACLLGLNTMHGRPLDPPTLMQLGGELGSDVPFFLCGSPLALAWSRGERLLALPALPSRPVLVAHPGVPLATAGAFRSIAAARGGQYQPRARFIALGQLESWSGVMQIADNDFGGNAVREVPVLSAGLDALRESGADIALLAGSGASIFGIFPEGRPLSAAERALQDLGFTCWQTTSLESLPEAANS
jgi:4-diphosphocytidyl-2-C-methyl-D-erythritol kinase